MCVCVCCFVGVLLGRDACRCTGNATAVQRCTTRNTSPALTAQRSSNTKRKLTKSTASCSGRTGRKKRWRGKKHTSKMMPLTSFNRRATSFQQSLVRQSCMWVDAVWRCYGCCFCGPPSLPVALFFHTHTPTHSRALFVFLFPSLSLSLSLSHAECIHSACVHPYVRAHIRTNLRNTMLPVYYAHFEGDCFENGPDKSGAKINLVVPVIENVNNAMACQAKCVENSKCSHFSYYTRLGKCYLKSTFTLSNTGGASGMVSGPAHCGQFPARRYTLSTFFCNTLHTQFERLPARGDFACTPFSLCIMIAGNIILRLSI